MPIKFKLNGLAETLVELLCCPNCGRIGGEGSEHQFSTANSKVTLEGIIIIAECSNCGTYFVPENQITNIDDKNKLIEAVKYDSKKNGVPLYKNREDVTLEAEKLNAGRKLNIH